MTDNEKQAVIALQTDAAVYSELAIHQMRAATDKRGGFRSLALALHACYVADAERTYATARRLMGVE